MQETIEYTVINNRVSPDTVELLIRERSKGKSLRQLGQMFNRSPERIRQVLAKYPHSEVTLLPEDRVAAKLGYPLYWLTKLRKEGIITDTIPAIKADKTLNLEAKRALISLVRALRNTAGSQAP